MARAERMKRKSFFVDEGALQRARKALGVDNESEVVRISVARVVEMEEYWALMRRSKGALKPGDFSDI